MRQCQTGDRVYNCNHERTFVMPNRTFLERLAAGELLVADGATGSNMQERGLTLGTAPEVWLYENPAAVVQLHRDFINARAPPPPCRSCAHLAMTWAIRR